MSHQAHDCEGIGPGFAQSCAEGMTQRMKHEVRGKFEQLPNALLLLAKQRRFGCLAIAGADYRIVELIDSGPSENHSHELCGKILNEFNKVTL